MKFFKSIILLFLLFGLTGCSLLGEYVTDVVREAEQLFEEATEEEYVPELNPEKELDFDKLFNQDEEESKPIIPDNTESVICDNGQVTCKELGDSYLDSLGAVAYLILEGTLSDENSVQQDYTPIVSYLVEGNQIIDPIAETSDHFYDDIIEDFYTHESIWEQIYTIIPEDEREMLRVLILYTDGKDNELGSVEPTEGDPREWMLNIDINDIDDEYNFINTIVHEFGHLLTLNDSQVDTIMDYYLEEDNPAEFELLKSTCPNYFTDYGCARENSYIQAFYERFWLGDLENEWLALDHEDEWVMYGFFEDHYDEFIHDYAATSIYEDITESWTYFVFSEQIEYPTEIWEEKVNFFYEYPELVQLRAEILQRVASQYE